MAYQLTAQDRKLAEQLANQSFKQQQAAAQVSSQPSKGGQGGFLASLLPTIGGTIGAVGGTLLGGPVGTVAGGAGGSALGEFLRQKISGEENDLGTMGREALLGAVPGGLGLLGKGVKAARGATAGVKAAATATDVASAVRPSGVVGHAKDIARSKSQKGFGLEVGQNMGRGKILTPDKADEMHSFTTDRANLYGGIKAGKPINQARDAQNVFNNVKTKLGSELDKINRPVTTDEITSIGTKAAEKVNADAAVTGTTKTLEKLSAKAAAAKDLKALEAVRMEADDLAFTSTGAGKTSAAAQARAVRESIDDLMTNLSPDYKAVKGDYMMAKEALEMTSKASKSAKGFKIPFIDAEVGKQSISGVKNKAAAMVSGDGTAGIEKTAGFRPFIKPAAQQFGTRAAATGVLGTPFAGVAPEAPEVAPDALLGPQPLGETVPAQPSHADAANKYLQETGDVEGASKLLAFAESMGAMSGSAEKPLSAEASKTIATANSGLQSLGLLESMVSEGGVPTGTVVPGRGLLGGAGQALLGTADFDAAADNVADAMVRARTGAAATKEELALYRRLLPQAFDSPEVASQKMRTVRDFFSSISNRTGSAGTDLETTVGAF